mgnify:CR=1 FL=1
MKDYPIFEALQDRFEIARQQPDKVKQAIDKLRTDGIVSTIEAISTKLDESIPLVDLGKMIYKKNACYTCHSTDGSKVIGPSFKGIWGTSEDNVFAVCTDGKILHYNGLEWMIEDTEDPQSFTALLSGKMG